MQAKRVVIGKFQGKMAHVTSNGIIVGTVTVEAITARLSVFVCRMFSRTDDVSFAHFDAARKYCRDIVREDDAAAENADACGNCGAPMKLDRKARVWRSTCTDGCAAFAENGGPWTMAATAEEVAS